jgi:hypothetical protein
MTRLAVGAVLVALTLGACGEDDGAAPIFADASPRPDARPLPDAANGPDAVPPPVDAAPLPDAPASALGPEVEILSPRPSTGSLDAADIVVGARFTATCRALANADTGVPLDPVSVAITAIRGGTSETKRATPTATPGEYAATFQLTGASNGQLVVQCTAADVSRPPEVNSDTVRTYLDLGPSVLVSSPTQNGFFSQQLRVNVLVIPAPVSASDPGAAVDPGSVEVCVAGAALPLEARGGGLYESIVFFDATRYTTFADPTGEFPGLVGALPFQRCGGGGRTSATLPWDPRIDGEASLRVTATNTRAGGAVARATTVAYVADSIGPAISITEPAPGELVGGFLTVAVDIDDPAGVVLATATLAHSFTFELVPSGGPRFTGTFDTRELDPRWIFPLLEVTAADAVGNERSAGIVIALDTRPPIVSMDSPGVREARTQTGPECLASANVGADPECGRCAGGDTAVCAGCGACLPGDLTDEECANCLDALGCTGCFECSRVFDPLGSDSMHDGQLAPQLVELRARVEDLANGPEVLADAVGLRVAAIKRSSGQLYVLDDTAVALLVDSEPDDCSPADPLDSDPGQFPSGCFCNAINPALVPTTVPRASMEVAVVDLVPVNATGRSDFLAPLCPYGDPGCTSPLGGTTESVGLVDAVCIAPDQFESSGPARSVCETTTITRVIGSVVPGDPALFTIPPLDAFSCTGQAFDSRASGIADGWACIATVAEDNLGNQGLSAPLRVCFDANGDGKDDDGSSLAAQGCATSYGSRSPVAGRPSCGVVADVAEVVPGTNCLAPPDFRDYPGFQFRILD